MPSNDVELELAIERQPDGTFRARVLKSATGKRVDEPFEPPFGEGEIDTLLRGLASSEVGHGGFREVGGAGAGAGAGATLPAVDHRAVGATLFDALFRGAVRDAFKGSLERVRAVPERRLSLRLLFGLGTGLPAHLASLPWELLYDPEAKSFLALDDEIRLVRELDVPRASERRPISGVPRFLVVMANAADQDPLGLTREWEALRLEMSSAATELVAFTGDSIGALRETLAEGRFFGLHFMGHGRFDPQRGRGELLFERGGVSHPVSGNLLATNLRNLPDLHWTVLNACHSGAQATGDDPDPLLGVASALLHGGQAAVVAMQTAMPDTAAIAFSHGFYRALAQGKDLEAAVYAGRLKVVNEHGEESGSWAIPALFMAPGRSMVGFGTRPEEDTDESPGPEPSGPKPVRAIRAVGASVVATLAVVLVVRFLPPSEEPTMEDSSSEEDSTTRSDPLTLPPPTKTAVAEPPPPIVVAKPSPPVSTIVPGKIAILVLDSQTRRHDREVAAAIETVLWDLGVDGLAPFVPDVDAAFVESLVGGDVGSLPGAGRAPWGAEYLLVVESSIEPRPHGLALTARARLLTADGETARLVQETQTGGGVARAVALTQATQRSFREIASTLRRRI